MTCSLCHMTCSLCHMTCSLSHMTCSLCYMNCSLGHMTCSLCHMTCLLYHMTHILPSDRKQEVIVRCIVGWANQWTIRVGTYCGHNGLYRTYPIVKQNECCFRLQFCAVMIYWARNNLGWLDKFWYETCPRCRIDHLTYWPTVRCTTTVLWLPPLPVPVLLAYNGTAVFIVTIDYCWDEKKVSL